MGKAAFVISENNRSKRFKNLVLHNTRRAREVAHNLARRTRTVADAVVRVFRRVYGAELAKDAAIWVIEAVVEGFILNFGLHQVFGVRMTLGTVAGYGFICRYIQDYLVTTWERLRKNGSAGQVPKK